MRVPAVERGARHPDARWSSEPGQARRAPQPGVAPGGPRRPASEADRGAWAGPHLHRHLVLVRAPEHDLVNGGRLGIPEAVADLISAAEVADGEAGGGDAAELVCGDDLAAAHRLALGAGGPSPSARSRAPRGPQAITVAPSSAQRRSTATVVLLTITPARKSSGMPLRCS